MWVGLEVPLARACKRDDLLPGQSEREGEVGIRESDVVNNSGKQI